MTLEELNIALNINECFNGSQNFEDIELEDFELFPKRIRYLCGLFISIADSLVYLIHQTAKEFLIAKDSNNPMIGWKHSIDPYISQSVLAKICVSYLCLSIFSEVDTQSRCFITFPEGLPYILNEYRFKLLKYTADNWVAHCAKSPGTIASQIIIDLCSPTIRRSIWLQACLGGEHPPKQFQNIAHTVSRALEIETFEETSAMPTLMILSRFGFLEATKAALISPLLREEVCQYWNNETALSFAIMRGDYSMV